MELFRGYVVTKDKKCLEKFKNRNDLKTYEQVKSLPEFAGILGEHTILVDIDEYEQSEILMNIVDDLQLKCRVYETTRGKHFLFKNSGVDNCKTHTKLACGLVADIKVGVKSSYSILKFDNKEREIIYDKLDDEEYEDLPKWLLPVKTNQDFLEMEEGSGRNQSLFNYILTLQSADFSVEEVRETIRILNNYILKEPLSKDELEGAIDEKQLKQTEAIVLSMTKKERANPKLLNPQRKNRIAKAKLIAPNPTHKLRPIVRGQTNKYNSKVRLGKGFTVAELKEAQINGINYARSLGIAIDLKRKDTCKETTSLNAQRIKDYVSRMILYPRKEGKLDKKAQVKEATEEQLKAPEAKMQNTCKKIIPFPKEEPGYSFSAIPDALKKENIYKKQRFEIKTAQGFYKRMEARKNKGAAKKK